MDLKVVKQDLFIGPKIKKIVLQKGGNNGSEIFLNTIKLKKIKKNWFFTSFDKFIFSDNNDIQFEFNQRNKIHKWSTRLVESYYLGAGAFTAVYGINIKNIKRKSDFNSELFSNKLIFRVFDDEKLDKFIKNWVIHKKLYPENIIDIYLHGDVHIVNEKRFPKLGQYVITREYYDHKYILENFNLKQRMKLLLSILEFLEKIKDKYQYYDLKLSNIGCTLDKDKDKDNITLILLDYDKSTLSKNPKKYSNTFFPLCILDGNNDNIHLGGLTDIIYRLFYELEHEQTHKILIIIYNLVKWTTDNRNLKINKIYPLMKSSINSINKKIIKLNETSLYLYILLIMIVYPSITPDVSKFYDITNLKNLVYTSINSSFDKLKAEIDLFIEKINQEIAKELPKELSKELIKSTTVITPSIDEKTKVIVPVPASVPEPVPEPAPEPVPEPAPEPERTKFSILEPERTRVIEPAPEPAPEPERTKFSILEPARTRVIEPVPEPAPEPESIIVIEPELSPVPEPELSPVQAPEPVRATISKQHITSNYLQVGGNINQYNYKQKYLKYKQKYFQLKKLNNS